MENELLTVSLRIGNYTTIEFDSVLRRGADENCLSYIRYDESEGLLATHGALFVNLNTKKVSMSYDIFNIVADILSVKKSGDNVLYTIATDKFKAELYIVERNLFAEKGEDLFI